MNLDQSFTDSIQNVLSAINALTADGGVDPPESQLKAMTSIVDNWLTVSGDLGFSGRANAQKIIVWGGDVYGHIAGDEPGSSGPPPDGYYPTLDETIEALTAQGIIVFALNPSDCDNGLNAPYAGAYSQELPARQQASDITNATGGTLFCNIGSGSPDINDAIVGSIKCYEFIKDDDLDDANSLDCRSPGDDLTYAICWDNDSTETLNDAYIKDVLPDGVSYPEGFDRIDPNFGILYGDPNYNEPNHTYTWDLGDLAPGDSGCVELEVEVNENAEPGVYMKNVAQLWATVYDANGLNPEYKIISVATKNTLVCCWDDSGIIYVDKSATDGADTGLNWTNAYVDLADALDRANNAGCSDAYTIYVAQGTYWPGESQSSTYLLPAGVKVYGGFKTGGCEFSERNPKQYETILTGLISE